MPFLDHLEELRWRLLKSIAAVVIGALTLGLFHAAVALARERSLVAVEDRIAPLEESVRLAGVYEVVDEMLVLFPFEAEFYRRRGR